MRKKKILIFIIIILLAAVTGFLMWRGVISFKKETPRDTAPKAGIAYTEGTEEYIIFDSDGRVSDISGTIPEEVPKLSGIGFAGAGKGDMIEWSSPENFSYAVEVLNALNDVQIAVNEIAADEKGEITLYIGGLKVLLGKNEKTAEKIRDLKDFISELKDKKGTLNMKEVNESLGYSFRPEKETVKQTEPETNEAAAGDDGDGNPGENGGDPPEDGEWSEDGNADEPADDGGEWSDDGGGDWSEDGDQASDEN